MLVCREVNIRDFEFWGGAKERVQRARDNGVEEQFFDAVEIMIEEWLPTMPTETEVNDLVWFNCDELLDELIENQIEEEK